MRKCQCRILWCLLKGCLEYFCTTPLSWLREVETRASSWTYHDFSNYLLSVGTLPKPRNVNFESLGHDCSQLCPKYLISGIRSGSTRQVPATLPGRSSLLNLKPLSNGRARNTHVLFEPAACLIRQNCTFRLTALSSCRDWRGIK